MPSPLPPKTSRISYNALYAKEYPCIVRTPDVWGGVGTGRSELAKKRENKLK